MTTKEQVLQNCTVEGTVVKLPNVQLDRKIYQEVAKALELIEMLKECRDLLVMCTLIDKSGHCKSLVDKVDTKMGWQ